VVCLLPGLTEYLPAIWLIKIVVRFCKRISGRAGNQVYRPPARVRISRAAAWHRIRAAAVGRSGHRVSKLLGQNSDQLLRQSPMLKLGTPLERFLHLWWNISTDQDTFSFHKFSFLVRGSVAQIVSAASVR